MNAEIAFGEVQFYFIFKDDDQDENPIVYAIISVYSPPDEAMLEDSYHALYACSYLGQENIVCAPITSIISVVSMQPLPRLDGDPENLWFVVEKSGLEDAQLFGYEAEN